MVGGIKAEKGLYEHEMPTPSCFFVHSKWLKLVSDFDKTFNGTLLLKTNNFNIALISYHTVLYKNENFQLSPTSQILRLVKKTGV